MNPPKALLIVLLVLALSPISNAQDERIPAEGGQLSVKSVGAPRWAFKDSRGRDVRDYGTEGDLLLFKAYGFRGETVSVAAYPYIRKASDGKDAQFQRITKDLITPNGLKHYFAGLHDSLGTWTKYKHLDRKGAEGLSTHLLFLPHDTLLLPDGKYHFTYLIKVWVLKPGAPRWSDEEEFYLDHFWIVEAKGGKRIITTNTKIRLPPRVDLIQLQKTPPDQVLDLLSDGQNQ